MFLFAVCVEVLQYFRLVELLGLQAFRAARIILGSVFDLKDIACYGVGCLGLALFEQLGRKGRPGPLRPALRRAVNRLRCDGHPICSADAGYFYAARRSEVRATVAQLTGRISKIAVAAKGLLQSYEETEG